MDLVNYTFRYAVCSVCMKTDIVLKPDHVIFLFSPEQNTYSCKLDNGSISAEIESGHCLTFLSPAAPYLITLTPQGQSPSPTCIVELPLAHAPSTVAKKVSKKEDKGKPIVTFNNSRIEFLLNELMSLAQKDACRFKKHSILLELISLQCERVRHENGSASAQVHYDKIMYAKHLIEENLQRTYTIPELAKLCGTNEQYLKKYFKLYLGTTIANYTLNVKMNFAKNLLMTGNHRIADIAQMIGYKHSTHFTTAFKRYFGFIPNSLRQILLSICSISLSLCEKIMYI